MGAQWALGITTSCKHVHSIVGWTGVCRHAIVHRIVGSTGTDEGVKSTLNVESDCEPRSHFCGAFASNLHLAAVS